MPCKVTGGDKLVKEPHVTIGSFTASPAQSVLANGVATVELAWQTTNATQVTLQPIGADVTGTTSYQATIRDTTQFTLVAEGQLYYAGETVLADLAVADPGRTYRVG